MKSRVYQKLVNLDRHDILRLWAAIVSIGGNLSIFDIDGIGGRGRILKGAFCQRLQVDAAAGGFSRLQVDDVLHLI